MAYCLRSFVDTLDQVLDPKKHYKKWVLDHEHRPQIQSLFENATFLQHFLDNSSTQIQLTISSLEDQIMDAAQKAADTLETYITNQILLNLEDQSFTIFPPDLGEVIRVFEDAKHELSKIRDASKPSDHIMSPPVSSTRYPVSKNTVVGVEEDLNQLRSRLTSGAPELDIIPIVGMGGIGKTTLAQLLYDEFSSKSHFDRCAWVTVSQSYDPQQILKTLLDCVTKAESPQRHTSDLKTTLYQTLLGRRYLIVLDDIWSFKAWDDVQRAFARENQGSRIIFTTRNNSLVEYVKSNGHEMQLINNDNSWKLLRGKVFGEESCPLELEEVGKRVALKCGGLPLALQVISGLLPQSERSKDFWEYVAHNVSFVAKTDDQFDGIFSRSFAHLPRYLKPCFLYMGVFPEDDEIPESRLIQLWIAEGFLYPVPNKSLEEAAEMHLNALVDRNLIFVRERGKNGKVKSYGIHPLLRDLCLRKAQEGVVEDLNQLRRRLTSGAPELDIIPIVGMGGMGKTTLARILYDEFKSSKSHFDCCAWATVSQSYDPQQILKTLLACVTKDDKSEQKSSDLITTLYQTLAGRRYLIVLNDIWSFKAWDDLQMAFAHDYQGSRIIITTRNNSLVEYIKSNGHEMHLINEIKSNGHEMQLINCGNSWKLLKVKVFGEKSCPCELEEVGKRIALTCGGLPLAVQVIGGLLAQSEISKDFWEYVANNVSSLVAKTDDQFDGIFSWSFAHLPHYLKPCFLYMGVFPEDDEIPESRLIQLWIAEGFLYPVPNKSLEEAAEMHLNALVDRNLIFVRERGKNGKVKSYGIHPLLRDLCLRKAQEKRFLSVKDSHTDILQDENLRLRLVSSHLPINNPEGFITMKLTSRTHSYLLLGNSKQYKLAHFVCFKPSLLHVLDVYQIKVDEFPEVFLQLVNLRYLSICIKPGEIPRNIYVLTNLQTLIVKYLMSSIALVLALPKLRHFELDDLIHTYEPRHDTFVGPHESLQSLYNIPLELLAGSLLGKLPKLRKLRIKCGYHIDNVDLNCFHELEYLKCCNGFYLANGNFISNITFPTSLKELALCSCGVPESLLNAINVLPRLQVLKLDACILMCPDWEPIEGGFAQLRYLRISCVRNLRNFLATDLHFPALQHLVLRNCPVLNEIPNDFGDIEYLEIIEVDECKPSVFDSARAILEEQLQFGNTLLKLRLGSVIE